MRGIYSKNVGRTNGQQTRHVCFPPHSDPFPCVTSSWFPHRNILSDQSGSTRGEWFVVGAGARLVGIDFLNAAPHTSTVVTQAAPLCARDIPQRRWWVSCSIAFGLISFPPDRACHFTVELLSTIVYTRTFIINTYLSHTYGVYRPTRILFDPNIIRWYKNNSSNTIVTVYVDIRH